MRAQVVSYEAAGLILKRRFGSAFTVAYGEILTAERLRSRRALRLHTRTGYDVELGSRSSLPAVEHELRRRGVRVVDCWGAIIAPTLLDFEEELARQPVGLRQSSDNA
jgi:hypothetical protein